MLMTSLDESVTRDQRRRGDSG